MRTLIQLKFCTQILHTAVALDTVTRSAEQLQIFKVVSAAFSTRYDVVHFQVAQLKMLPATRAIACLHAVKPLLVFGAVVGRQPAEISS